jgi:hypothetical protein
MSYCCPSCAEKERIAKGMGEPPIEYLVAKVELLQKVAVQQMERGELGEAIKNVERMVKTLHRIGLKND